MLIPLVFALAAATATARFPPGPKVLLSPDGAWRIINRDPIGNEDLYRLLLKRRGGEVRTLYRYGRNVLVTWSPDSRRIAITDYAGSNVAECLVVDAQTLRQTDVTADAARASPRIARVLGNFHSYFECVRWTSATALKVRVSGYGDNDPQGATVTTTYRLR